ncbi:uncharacterized protein LOC141787048 [Halichoeres trimaculatus]|uniref:uncharacterized protein LOC141787048 n=1 Tax=Halichoeres trimaculatus TaxID=147232 RepID=UPI003D9E7DDC
MKTPCDLVCVQMAALGWTLVLSALLLSAGTTLADVDQDWLTSIMEGIKTEYALGDTFSLAVNVPLNQDPNTLQEVLQYDPADRVQQAVSEGGVYQGRVVIAAAQAGSLPRVLENIRALMKSSQGHFLVLYSQQPPCGPACAANDDPAPAKVQDITQHWSAYAFVFSRVRAGPPEDLSRISESFRRLHISGLGLNNVFRCFGDDALKCTSCSSGPDVTPSCVADHAPSDQEADQDQSPVPAAGSGAGELIPQDSDLGPSLGGALSTGVGGGERKGRKDKGGVRRRKGRKGKGKVRRRKGRKGKGKVRRRKGRKGKEKVRRRKGRKGKGKVRRRKGRKGKGRKKKGGRGWNL